MLLIEKLEAVARGDIDRLMVLMPPGSAKSTYASVLFPAWWFCRHPRSAVIAASHNGELAEKFGRLVRNTVNQNADMLGYSISADNKAAGRWETNAGGEYYATGAGGSITGRRADLAVIDDPVKSSEEVGSEDAREKIWNWYRSDFYTRLKPNAKIVLIMTRWNEDDLGGRLLAEMANGGDQWDVLCLPALATANDDPLGRAFGEPLWPEWEGAEELARKQTALGPYFWAALFQQVPQPPGGAFFAEADFLVDGKPVPMPTRCDSVFAVIDSATKTGKTHDGTAVVYFARSQRVGYPLVILGYSLVQIEGSLLDTWLLTVFDELERLSKLTKARMGSAGTWIEDKSSGMILLQQAQRRGWPARPIDSKLTSVGKSERAINVSGYIFQKNVKISDAAYDQHSTYKNQTKNHLMSQVLGFHIGVDDGADDILDCVTYGVALALGDSEGF